MATRGHATGAQGDVGGRVGRGAAVGGGVDAEEAEVARVAGPPPVVALPAELAHRRGRGHDEAHVGVVAVDREPVLRAAVVAVHHAHEGGVGLADGLTDGVAHGVGHPRPLLLARTGRDGGQDAPGDILLAHQEAHVQPRAGQLVGAAAGHETVGNVVVPGGGVLLHGLEAAVVVGEHQPLAAHHHARAEAAEAHHGILQRRAAGVVQLAGREAQAQLTHGAAGACVEPGEHPHAFVGKGGKGQQAEKGGEEEGLHRGGTATITIYYYTTTILTGA